MTEHKFTDEEIIKTLTAYTERQCGNCNVADLLICCQNCYINMVKRATYVITRQKIEIKTLTDLLRPKNYKPKGTKTIGEYVPSELGVQLTIDDMEDNND